MMTSLALPYNLRETSSSLLVQIMSGLLGLVGRGSIGQAVLAVVLAFAFFALAFKFQPFASAQVRHRSISVYTSVSILD
jgi:hypothetical protein